MDHIDPAIGSLTVLPLEGPVVRLDSFWARRTALLVFVRHFG